MPTQRPLPLVDEHIHFELFNLEVVSGVVTEVDYRTEASTTWAGVIDDHTPDNMGGTFMLTCVQNSCVGNIKLGSHSVVREFLIKPTSINGRVYINISSYI